MDDFKPLNLTGSGEPGNNEDITSSGEPENNEETTSFEEAADSGAAQEEAAELGETEAARDETVEAGENAAEADGEVGADSSETVAEEAEKTDEDISADKTAEQPDKLDKVLEAQQQLLERLEALDALFKARIMYAEHEEKIVDQMHKELQKYKEDMYAQLVRPILLDVIEVRDSILRMAAAYLAKPEGEQSIPNKTFSDYAYDLQDILERNSVEIYRSKPEDDFTPIKQRIIKKIATSDESLHGKVAESLSCGYSYNGRTISAEKIAVYFYEKDVQ